MVLEFISGISQRGDLSDITYHHQDAFGLRLIFGDLNDSSHGGEQLTVLPLVKLEGAVYLANDDEVDPFVSLASKEPQ